MKSNAIGKVYMVIAGAVTVASVSLSIGLAIGKAQTPGGERLEARVQNLEKLCERWDERWTNLSNWMARIDAKLARMEGK